jgi:hypothetical protein
MVEHYYWNFWTDNKYFEILCDDKSSQYYTINLTIINYLLICWIQEYLSLAVLSCLLKIKNHGNAFYQTGTCLNGI